MRLPDQVTDQNAIQGLWRLISYISQSRPVTSSSTHYQFKENMVKEVSPSLVDGGSWAAFELDTNARPKRLTVTYEWVGRDGQTVSRIYRNSYELDGDTLRVCIPRVWGTVADVISDKEHSVITLVRDNGPPPATKLPAGKKPVEDAVLGQVIWNDNYDNWEARLELKTGSVVDFHLWPGGRSDEAILEAGREAVQWLRNNEPAARHFAASRMLDGHNDSWNDGEPISAEAFASRMTLETASIQADGGIDLYYQDGDLFWGHCIIISVSGERQFIDASIAG
jgi:uncharacterized protein (TIGR03067 family)